ncbi:MAG: hypothetical protein QNI90_15200 [Dinoroseobacter sp.]|nr:hypothetical protein [Dinoroseobacter sp.]MDJ0994923.1 hypothetical protein [Dinoroseobacter sp.]
MSTLDQSYSKQERAQIQWNYTGPTDALVGSGASSAERLMGYGGAALLTVLLTCFAYLNDAPVTTWWQWAVLVFFAYDIGGGAVANMLNSCKRFYHSPPKPAEGRIVRAAKDVRVFTAIHIHPIVAAALLGGSVANAVIWYVLLQLAVWTVLLAPLYLRRPLATLLTISALIVESNLLPLGPGLEWFLPCLFIKMVMGHAVQEEPYAPSST